MLDKKSVSSKKSPHRGKSLFRGSTVVYYLILTRKTNSDQNQSFMTKKGLGTLSKNYSVTWPLQTLWSKLPDWGTPIFLRIIYKITWGWVPGINTSPNFIYTLWRVLLELVSDTFLVGGPIRMIVLALISIGAFFAVRTSPRRHLDFFAQKLVQSWTIFSKRIIRRHEPEIWRWNYGIK